MAVVLMTWTKRGGTFDEEESQQIEGLVLEGFEVVWGVREELRMDERYWAMNILVKRKMAYFSERTGFMEANRVKFGYNNISRDK